MSKFNKILLSILNKTESKKRDNIKNIFEFKELSQNLIPFDKEKNYGFHPKIVAKPDCENFVYF